MAIPALSRGLILLESLIHSRSPLRFSQLKLTIPGISDTSLNRLLQSLLEDGYIEKNSTGSYQLTQRVADWGNTLGRDNSFKDRIDYVVRTLAERTNESAAYALLEGDRILIKSHYNIENSISIIKTDSILHFESDHAAAMAILAELSEERQKYLIGQPESQISSYSKFTEDLNAMYDGTCYFDISRIRPGVSRAAVSHTGVHGIGALFLCFPSQILKNPGTREKIQKQLSVCRGLIG